MFAMYERDPHLTRVQRQMLWTLVRREAIALGYSTHYTEENRDIWPAKLKKLAVIARKLRA